MELLLIVLCGVFCSAIFLGFRLTTMVSVNKSLNELIEVKDSRINTLNNLIEVKDSIIKLEMDMVNNRNIMIEQLNEIRLSDKAIISNYQELLKHETKVYLVLKSVYEVDMLDEEFIVEAEKIGMVYSLIGFEDAIFDINIDDYVIRFI